MRGVWRWISQREILEGTLHKFDFDPKLQKNWVIGETWELKAPASLRQCDPSRGGEGGQHVEPMTRPSFVTVERR